MGVLTANNGTMTSWTDHLVELAERLDSRTGPVHAALEDMNAELSAAELQLTEVSQDVAHFIEVVRQQVDEIDAALGEVAHTAHRIADGRSHQNRVHAAGQQRGAGDLSAPVAAADRWPAAIPPNRCPPNAPLVSRPWSSWTPCVRMWAPRFKRLPIRCRIVATATRDTFNPR